MILSVRVTCTCGKVFKTDEALKQHQRDSSIHKKVSTTKPIGKIKCSCGKTVKDEDGLENHVRSSLRHRRVKESRSDAAKKDDMAFLGFLGDSVVSHSVLFTT